jgi:hypothetical protein
VFDEKKLKARNPAAQDEIQIFGQNMNSSSTRSK